MSKLFNIDVSKFLKYVCKMIENSYVISCFSYIVKIHVLFNSDKYRGLPCRYSHCYNYVCLCMTMYDYVWLCMTMYDYVWLCMAMYDYVWLCITKYD